MNHFTQSELDPEILATPFEIETRWNVLTGAACCGKTTLIEIFSERGFQFVPESAREYFMDEMAKGRELDEIRRDGQVLQRDIAARQLQLEQGADPDKVTFLDRAIPDSLTFYRVHGMNPNEILPECFHYHYANVFILSRLPFLRDKTLGPEDDATSDFLDEWLVRDYEALGYTILRVPVASPQERVNFILESIMREPPCH